MIVAHSIEHHYADIHNEIYRYVIDIYPHGVYNINAPLRGVEEVSMEKGNDCSHKTKQRSAEEYKSLINRLNRIEGQVRGVKKMLDADTYCTEILTQVSAIQAALHAFNRELLANHIHTCVANDIRNGKDETMDELVLLLQKLMK